MNFHAYGNMWITPYNYNSNDNYFDMMSFKHATWYSLFADILHNKNFKIVGNAQATINYTANGEASDWMLAKKNIIAMSPELGRDTRSSQYFYINAHEIGESLETDYEAVQEFIKHSEPLVAFVGNGWVEAARKEESPVFQALVGSVKKLFEHELIDEMSSLIWAQKRLIMESFSMKKNKHDIVIKEEHRKKGKSRHHKAKREQSKQTKESGRMEVKNKTEDLENFVDEGKDKKVTKKNISGNGQSESQVQSSQNLGTESNLRPAEEATENSNDQVNLEQPNSESMQTNGEETGQGQAEQNQQIDASENETSINSEAKNSNNIESPLNKREQSKRIKEAELNPQEEQTHTAENNRNSQNENETNADNSQTSTHLTRDNQPNYGVQRAESGNGDAEREKRIYEEPAQRRLIPDGQRRAYFNPRKLRQKEKVELKSDFKKKGYESMRMKSIETLIKDTKSETLKRGVEEYLMSFNKPNTFLLVMEQKSILDLKNVNVVFELSQSKQEIISINSLKVHTINSRKFKQENESPESEAQTKATDISELIDVVDLKYDWKHENLLMSTSSIELPKRSILIFELGLEQRLDLQVNLMLIKAGRIFYNQFKIEQLLKQAPEIPVKAQIVEKEVEELEQNDQAEEESPAAEEEKQSSEEAQQEKPVDQEKKQIEANVTPEEFAVYLYLLFVFVFLFSLLLIGKRAGQGNVKWVTCSRAGKSGTIRFRRL